MGGPLCFLTRVSYQKVLSPFLLEADGKSAINVKTLTRDVRRFVAGEECDEVCDFIGISHPFEGNLSDDFFFQVLWDLLREGRVEESGRDDVHVDVVFGELERPGSGETDDAGLRRGVIGLADVS